MYRDLPGRSTIVDRQDLLNALTGLLVAKYLTNAQIEMSDDGYHRGFIDALLAVATSAGVELEFGEKAAFALRLGQRPSS